VGSWESRVLVSARRFGELPAPRQVESAARAVAEQRPSGPRDDEAGDHLGLDLRVVPRRVAADPAGEDPTVAM
ncbi:MAG: DNA recombination protein RmuC, partial [Nocardioidaceae bacterium]|nr:DNA recombination protein RmuC [Nocardioidaceae bacterium]